MGIDAPSTDLTARTRGARRAFLAAGAIDPATGRSDHSVEVDLSRVQALGAAQERRAARATFPEDEEFEALGLSEEDGGELAAEAPLPDEVVLELTTEEQETADAEWKELTERADEYVASVDTAQSDAILTEVFGQVVSSSALLIRVAETQERQSDVLLLLAKGIQEMHEELADALLVLARTLAPPPPWYTRLWRSLFG